MLEPPLSRCQILATKAWCCVYIDDISHLFQSQTEEEYNESLLRYSKDWDPLFAQYFMKEIHPLVPVHIGRLKLESLHLYNPYSGVTNNQLEGFNTVMKEFQAWKEAPVDSFVLALYQLQSYYSNEIQRGLAGMCESKCIQAYKLHLLYTYVGLGEYHLRTTCKSIQLDLEDLELISTKSPGDIVKHLRVKNPDDAATNVTAENFDDGPERLNIDSQPVTMLSRARALVEGNKISFNPQMHVFNVQGTHDVRVVSLS